MVAPALTVGYGIGGRGTFMPNLNPVPVIVALDKPDLKIRDIIGTTAPPKMNDSTDMCLSFLLPLRGLLVIMEDSCLM
jgi:hypothetical protein